MSSEVSTAPLPVTATVPRELDRECLERIQRILAGREAPPLMTPPPEVQDIVAREAERLTRYITPESRQRMQDDLCLQYHYGGNEVLTWESPEGLVVFAVDSDPVTRVLDRFTAEQRLLVLIRFPPSWWNCVPAGGSWA